MPVKARTTYAEPELKTNTDAFDSLRDIKSPEQSQGALSTHKVGTMPTQKVADKKTTAKAATQYDMPADAASHMRSLLDKLGDVEDEVSTDDLISSGEYADYFSDYNSDAPTDTPTPTPEPVPHQSVAKVASTVWNPDQPIEREIQGFDPEWHAVKNLPGYIQQGIRVLGRQVFKQFTETKHVYLAEYILESF